MRFFEKKLSLVILLFTLPLLFLPKINLISVESETAGLRIDDLVLFFVGGLLMWSHTLSHQRLYKIEGWLLLITGFSVLSFISNRFLVSTHVLYMDAKIFYIFRLLEYFMFFYLGAISSHYFKINTIVWAFFAWNLAWMILQKLDLAGAITSAGYHTGVSTRVHGIASFPSEMGLLLNLMFCFILYDESARSRFIDTFPPALRFFIRKFYLYGLFGLFGMFVIFTGNRISILALVVCFLARLRTELTWRSTGSIVLLLCLIPILTMGVIELISQTDSVYKRSLDLFSYKNLELGQIVWDKIDMTKNPVGNEVTESSDYDMSWWMRIHKWIYVIKAYATNPITYLQGLGPGFAWAALDGGVLRIFIEYGIIGSVLFWKFFNCLYQINRQLKWMMIAFFINMIFFDAYLAYKTMSFLFFVAGDAFEREHRVAYSTSQRLPKLMPSFSTPTSYFKC